MSVSEGQWNVLHSRRAAAAESINANDSGTTVAAGRVLYGVDATDCRHLLVPVHAREIAEDRDSQGVQIGTRTLRYDGADTLYADLVCLKPRFNSEFGHIVEDVLHALAQGAPPESACRDSLEKWRDLLRAGRATGLDESSAIGLFGELLMLRELCSFSADAIRSWTGPEGGRFDFTGSDVAIEVKSTTRRYGRLVEINGEGQLDAPDGVTLHMSFVRLEPVPSGERGLWDLYTGVLMCKVSEGVMQQKLERLDLDESVLREDPRRYRVTESRLYRVDSSFPKIVPGSFREGGLPAGAMRLRYMIDLSGEPPLPLAGNARQAVLNRLVRAGANADEA